MKKSVQKNSFRLLLNFLIFLSFAIVPSRYAHADFDLKAEVARYKALLDSLPEMPQKPYVPGVETALIHAIADVRERLETWAIFERAKSYEFELRLKSSYEIAQLRAELYKALLRDLKRLQKTGRIDSYRLKTYSSPEGTPLPPEIERRYELNNLLCNKLYLLRMDVSALMGIMSKATRWYSDNGYSIPLSRAGVITLLSKSNLGSKFAAQFLSNPSFLLSDVEVQIVSVSKRILDPKISDDPSLDSELNSLMSTTSRNMNLMTTISTVMTAILPMIDRISAADAPQPGQVEGDLARLGQGLRATLDRTLQLPEHLKSHRSYFNTDPLDPNILWLTDPYTYFKRLMEYGETLQDSLSVCSRLATIQYVIVAGTVISKAMEKSLKQKALAAARSIPLLGSLLGGKPSSAEEGSSAAPIDPQEQRLWRIFIENAGIEFSPRAGAPLLEFSGQPKCKGTLSNKQIGS